MVGRPVRRSRRSRSGHADRRRAAQLRAGRGTYGHSQCFTLFAINTRFLFASPDDLHAFEDYWSAVCPGRGPQTTSRELLKVKTLAE